MSQEQTSQYDRADLNGAEYQKQIAILYKIATDVIKTCKERESKIGKLPSWFLRFEANWASLLDALENRQVGALMQAWWFVEKEVTPNYLNMLVEDAHRAIERFNKRFVASVGATSMGEATAQIAVAEDVEAHIRTRIESAKNARRAAAKAWSQEMFSLEQKLKQKKQAEEAKAEKQIASLKGKIASPRVNSNKGSKSQEALDEALSNMAMPTPAKPKAKVAKAKAEKVTA